MSQNFRHATIGLIFKNDLHRLDKVNFSKTRGTIRSTSISAVVIPLDTISEKALPHVSKEELELQMSKNPMNAYPTLEASRVTNVGVLAMDHNGKLIDCQRHQLRLALPY